MILYEEKWFLATSFNLFILYEEAVFNCELKLFFLNLQSVSPFHSKRVEKRLINLLNKVNKEICKRTFAGAHTNKVASEKEDY